LTLARHRSLIAAALVAAIGASAVVAAPPTAAQQQPGSERSQIRGGETLVSVNVDVLRTEDTEVTGALSDVRENVSNQKAALTEAQGALTAVDVLGAQPGPKRDQAIGEWMASVWAAWRDSHAQVAALLRELGEE